MNIGGKMPMPTSILRSGAIRVDNDDTRLIFHFSGMQCAWVSALVHELVVGFEFFRIPLKNSPSCKQFMVEKLLYEGNFTIFVPLIFLVNISIFFANSCIYLSSSPTSTNTPLAAALTLSHLNPCK